MQYFGQRFMDEALLRLTDATDEPFYIEEVDWHKGRVLTTRFQLFHKEDGMITTPMRPERLERFINAFLKGIEWGQESLQRRLDRERDAFSDRS